ncbi:MAG: hypothetical protein AAGD28_17195, partial [Bacteroidota bacterium]
YLQKIIRNTFFFKETLQVLDKRPVLILYHTDFYNGKRELRGNPLEPAWSILQNSHKIIEKYEMEEVAREGPFILYKGYIL